MHTACHFPASKLQDRPPSFYITKEVRKRGDDVGIHDIGEIQKAMIYDALISDIYSTDIDTKHETLKARISEEIGVPCLSKHAQLTEAYIWGTPGDSSFCIAGHVSGQVSDYATEAKFSAPRP